MFSRSLITTLLLSSSANAATLGSQPAESLLKEKSEPSSVATMNVGKLPVCRTKKGAEKFRQASVAKDFSFAELNQQFWDGYQCMPSTLLAVPLKTLFLCTSSFELDVEVCLIELTSIEAILSGYKYVVIPATK